MTYFVDILNCKTNFISDDEIFDKGEEDKPYYHENLNLKDLVVFNEKTDLILYTLDFKLFASNNQTINESDISCDINDEDLYYTKTKNMRIFSVINDEENEIRIKKNKTNISNRNEFEVQRKKKDIAKLGRKRKGEIKDKENSHSKDGIDNIRIKYKRLFFNNLIKFLNKRLRKSKNLRLNSLSFKKLNSEYIKKLTKKINLEMLNSPAFVILSLDIAKQYKNFDKDYNKKIIDLILKENDESLISILNKNIGQLMKIFCSDKKEDDLFMEYKRLDEYIANFIDELPENENEEDYFKKLKYEGENFEKSLNSISGRNRKMKVH